MKTTRRLIDLIQVIGIIFISAIALNSILRPVGELSLLIDVLRPLSAVALLLAAFFLYRRFFKDTLTNKEVSRKAMFWAFVSIIVVHVIFGVAIMGDPSRASWDVGVVVKQAGSLAGMSDTYGDLYVSQDFLSSYYSMYPNNTIITFILTAWFKMCSFLGLKDIAIASLALNIVVMDLAIIATFLVARKLLGLRSSYVVLAIVVVFIVLSPWTRVPYSDAIGLFFPVAILLTYLKLIDSSGLRSRVLYSILLGSVVGIGYGIKPTVIFMFIAIMIDAATRLIGSKSFAPTTIMRAALVAIACVGSAVLVYVIGYSFIDSKIGINESRSMPITHFLMMGSEMYCPGDISALCRFGGYNDKDLEYYNAHFASNSDSSQYRDYTAHEAVRRITVMGVPEYPLFLLDKSSWFLGDGTFGAYKEGVESRTPPINQGSVLDAIQDVAYISGPWYEYFKQSMNILWTVVVLGLFTLLMTLRKINTGLLPLILSVCMLIVFLMIFETRSRYIYLYIPIFVILAVYGLGNVFSALSGIINKRS